MEAAGKVNQYRCNECRFNYFTVNLNCGVTPMFIRCDKCGGMCSSAMYNINPADVKESGNVVNIIVTHVFYRPRSYEYSRLDRQNKECVLNGQLLIRKLIDYDILDPNNDLISVNENISFKEFQTFCKRRYGEMLDELNPALANQIRKIEKGMRELDNK